MNAKYCAAVLFKDLAVSRRFYEELLGQKVEMDFGPNIGYVGGLSLWEVQHAFSMVFQRAPEGNAPLGRENLELYFEIDDLDAAQQTLSAAGIKLVHPVIGRPGRSAHCKSTIPMGM